MNPSDVASRGETRALVNPAPAGRGTLSVLILAKNEESRIGACLERVVWADEVLVVDDVSTDRTAEISRARGARVAQRAFDDFASQANFGLEQLIGDWVLTLDADELVTPALRDAIQTVLEGGSPHEGLTFRRRNYFLGRWMRYGGWYHRSLHLFRRQAGRFVGKVHYAPELRGSIGELDADVEHYPFQSLTQFVARQNRYTSIEAEELAVRHPNLSKVPLRQQLWLRPAKLFWKSYVKKSGWREGMHGLVFGMLFAWVEFLKWAKYWAMKQESRPASATRAFDIETAETVTRRQVGSGRSANRARLSVVILTKNEEEKIARCLQSVRWADEIIVVDGCSEDRTAEICRAFGATVIAHAFEGSFATERNLGMAHASGEWVLQIDADDVVTPEFRDAVEAMLCGDSPYAAYKFRRRSVLAGRVMRYGGWYYAVPNLVRRDRVRYEGTVHERPVVAGEIGELDADIEHHPCEDLATFVARHNRYTSLQATELLTHLGVKRPGQIGRLMWKRSWKTFWKSYVKKQGYREGLHGLVFAEFFAGVEWLKWAKYWELCWIRSGQTSDALVEMMPSRN